jgi:putative DNA primase/helicase
MDIVGQFIDECCMCIPEASVKEGVIYAEYCKWCETNHENALNQRNFGLKLSARGFTRARGTANVHIWKGIGLSVTTTAE